MDWCDVCKYNPPDYLSHEPDKPCGDCWVYGEGNEPSKFVETESRQTNYDLLISKTPEELAEWVTTKGRTFGEEYEGYMSVLDWLKAPVEEGDDGRL